MRRLTAGVIHRDPKTGVLHVFSKGDEVPDWLEVGAHLIEGGVDSGDYSSMKVGELREEIARRNEGRDEADVIPDDGNKADLVAALEADDNN